MVTFSRVRGGALVVVTSPRRIIVAFLLTFRVEGLAICASDERVWDTQDSPPQSGFIGFRGPKSSTAGLVYFPTSVAIEHRLMFKKAGQAFIVGMAEDEKPVSKKVHFWRDKIPQASFQSNAPQLDSPQMAPTRQRKPWMEFALEHYTYANEVFVDRYGDCLFAVGGTLLGAIREGGFISHDKDMDVAYLSQLRDADSVRREFVDRICDLIQAGERVTLVNSAGRFLPRHAKWWSQEKDAYFDLFPSFFDRQGRYTRPTFVCVKLPKRVFEPFLEVPFEDGKMWVPNDSHEKLVTIVGEGWAKPDPGWTKPEFRGAPAARRLLTFSQTELDRIQSVSRQEDAQELSAARKRAGR